MSGRASQRPLSPHLRPAHVRGSGRWAALLPAKVVTEVLLFATSYEVQPRVVFGRAAPSAREMLLVVASVRHLATASSIWVVAR